VPALSVDAWRFPSLLGPPDRLRARFAPDALPHGRDLDALLAASEVAGTLLAPSAAGGRAVAGGRWGPLWPVREMSRPEAFVWCFNVLMFTCAALALLDMLLVSSEVKWNPSTTRTFMFALMHSLLTQDGAKVRRPPPPPPPHRRAQALFRSRWPFSARLAHCSCRSARRPRARRRRSSGARCTPSPTRSRRSCELTGRPVYHNSLH